HGLVDAQDGAARPGQLELDRFVVDEARRGVHGSLGQRGTLTEVGVELDVEVRWPESGRAQQRLEHDPAASVLAWSSELSATEIARGLDAARLLCVHH